METPHRKRCKRFNDTGHAHFLTFSCFQRRPFLVRDRSRQWLADAVNSARERHDFHVWAYVIMPEHVHLIIFPQREVYEISDVLSSIKQSVAKRALAFVERESPAFLTQMADVNGHGEVTHRFWQRGGGYDRNLRDAHETWEKIDYVHDNPVERELCASPLEWIWSSAADHAGARTGVIKIDLETIPRRPI
jgi:putative transposase